jgi:hypothetical protein
LEKPNCDTPDALWGDDDEKFDLGLEKWGVNVEELKKPLRGLFKCWVEDWENVLDKGDVMRTKFLVKYGGLVFDDINDSPPVRMRVSSIGGPPPGSRHGIFFLCGTLTGKASREGPNLQQNTARPRLRIADPLSH